MTTTCDRLAFVREQVAGRRVLDIGCVNHESRTMTSPDWLHGLIAGAATECLGVDILENEVEELRRAGFDAITLDITTGPNEVVRQRAPFDVVTAGEVIEHLASPQALFDFAAEILRPGGRLVITTPNPYTPARVRAAHLRDVWENVDHVAFSFPSGIAELAERAGMRLVQAGTSTSVPLTAALARSVKDLLKGVVKKVVGVQRERASGRLGLPLPPHWESPLDICAVRLLRGTLQLGESALYLVEQVQ